MAEKAHKISESTLLQLDLKTIGLIIFFSVSLAGFWFSIQAQIQTAMEEPKPEVSSIEFSYKDQLTRKIVEGVQADMSTIKDDVKEIKEQLDKLDARLYELSTK